jgi:hypothetical protein
MNHLNRSFLLGLLALLSASCAASLSLLPSELQDRSAPAAKKAEVSAIMVLPPRGSERGQQSELADLERILLAKGFRVISSGITGRVASDTVEARADEATRLSDLERALILAKKSNADALLQVGELGFKPSERYFAVLEGDREKYAEIPEPPDSRGSCVVRIKEARFGFEAKLINVENGEIVISVDLSQSTSRVAPSLDMIIQLNREETVIEIDTLKRRQAATTQVMEGFSSHIFPPRSQPGSKK